ncbi:MAG: radical SAM protein [Deferribacteraceae bacterium]|jgi:radical SAM protein with 4Fe4S-binding SPASM domain|nr:radical SAM protein [Deferribacteraceae bacterium]
MGKQELKWMAWELTSQCNMACVHCRSSSEAESPVGAFSASNAEKLLDDIALIAKPVVVLSGGEPLLRGDLFQIAAMGTSRGFRMAMATNGLLVDDEVCRKIKDAGINIISMSLDADNPNVHDNFRGQPGAFEAVMKAAGLFQKHDIKFIINSSFTRRNQSRITQTYQLSKKIGAIAWYMFLIVPTGRAEGIMDELISKEDYEDILEWHYRMEREEGEILVRPTCAPQYYRIWNSKSKSEGLDAKRRALSFSTGGGKGCIAGQSILFINSMGEVYPCSYFPISAGNVFKQSIGEIWESSELFRDLRDFKRYGGKCGKSRYIGVCGGCRARSYAVQGDYLAEEPFCSYIPEAYSFSIDF